MNPSNSLTISQKRFLAGIVIVAVVFVLIVVYSLFSVITRPSTPTKTINITPLSLTYPLGSDLYENKLYFSNGRSFIRLDVNSGKSEALSPETVWPDIGTLYLKQDGSGVIFQTINQSFEDILGKQLSTKNLPLDEPYWWSVSFADNKASLITDSQGKPATMRRTVIDRTTQNLVGIKTSQNGSGSTTVYVFNQNLVPTAQYNLNAYVTNFVPKGNTLYYHDLNSSLIAKANVTDGSNRQTIASDATDTLFSPNAEWAFVIDKQPNKDNKLLGSIINLVTKQRYAKNQVIDESLVKWSSDGKYFAGPAENQGLKNSTNISLFDTQSQKSTTLVVQNTNDAQAFAGALAFDGQTFLLRATDYSLYVGSTERIGLHNTVLKETDIIAKDSIVITPTKEGRVYLVTVEETDKTDRNRAKEQAYSMLRNKGVNVDLVKVLFTFQRLRS